MRTNIGFLAGADQDVALREAPHFRRNIALGTTHCGEHQPGGEHQPSAQSQLDPKEIRRSYSWSRLADTPVVGLNNGQHPGSRGSLPLVPPGPSSPHDSQAPALRYDGSGVTNTSNGSDPMSHQGGGSFPGTAAVAATEPNFYNSAALEELAIPDLSDLPLDIPDFGGLDVPSLEELVQDIGAAEAELMATKGFGARLGLLSAAGARGINLLRSQTLPVPSTLPLSKPASRTKIKLKVRKNSTDAPRGSLSAEGGLRQQQQEASGSDGSGAARRKRKPALETQAEMQPPPPQPEVAAAAAVAPEPEPDPSQPSPFAAVTLGLGWGSRTASDDLNYLSGHASKKIEVNSILDDDALLEKVMADTAPLARPKPKDNRSLDLAPASSLPNKHWLSPAAAIHAVHASKPGDEDVIKWLLYGK